MRGIDRILIGYVLGNEKARKWLLKKFCQASCIVDREFKKTPLGKIITEKKNDDISKVD